MGKPNIPHLLYCQGFGVVYYSLTLGRLGSWASSTFATLGFTQLQDLKLDRDFQDFKAFLVRIDLQAILVQPFFEFF